MGGAASSANNNSEMVGNLIKDKYIRSVRVERAFRAVDRGHFFPDNVDVGHYAFNDNAWREGSIHISSPCIYSETIERLDLQPGNSFLNLGSGTGYLSTIAGLLLGSNGLNHGIELVPEMVKYAQEHVASFIRKSISLDMFEFAVPKFVWGNFLLLPPGVEYDRIYCGAACSDLDTFNFLQGLLKIGGKLITPFNSELMLVERISKDHYDRQSLLSVAFTEIQAVTPSTNIVPVLPLPKVRSLKVLCRTTIRTAIRQHIYETDPQLPYKNSLIYFFDKTGSESESRAAVPIQLRTKLDSGIVEDIYFSDDDDYSDEEQDIDSDDSDAPHLDSTFAKEFSTTMLACIHTLELPRTLVKFLNFNRDL